MSARLIEFDKPTILSACQFFSIGDGWRVKVLFSVDEEFQIVESKYYIYAPGEIYLQRREEDLDSDRLEQYMDFETMKEILEQ